MSSLRSRVILTLMVVLGVLISQFASPARAGELHGVFHDPYGQENLYSQEADRRTPSDPEAGQEVFLHATTWPVSTGQAVWVTWKVNGLTQSPRGFQWAHNASNNSYWKLPLGSFARGDLVEYTIYADVDGSGQRSTKSFSFRVTGWNAATSVSSVTLATDHALVRLKDADTGLEPAVRLAFPSADQMRVQVSPRAQGLNILGAVMPSLSQTSTEAVLMTSSMTVVVHKNPYSLEVRKPDGTVLMRQTPGTRLFADDGARATHVSLTWATSPGERFEGLGERYDALNQLGRKVYHYVYNQYRDQGATGRTYLSVPLLRNAKGYGLFVNTLTNVEFDLGVAAPDSAQFSAVLAGAQALEFSVFTGTPARILDSYTAATGRPKLPPKWAFGPWMSANEWNTQAEVEAELAKVRQYEIPHTAMVLEQWSDEATFYLWHGATYTPKPGSETLRYSDLKFPAGSAWTDPRAVVDAAHRQGVKVLLWQIPVLKQNFDTNPSTAPVQHVNDREHALKAGYVVKRKDGAAYRIPSDQWFGDSLVPDFTNQAAIDWWMSKRSYLLDEVGVDGFKTDGGELIFGRDAVFSNGADGQTMHNGYPNLYTGAYARFLDSARPGSALFSRSGAQSAQTTSIFWAGDQNSSWTAFQEAIRAGLSAGQSGVPFWSWDMAGFTGEFPSSELYLRAAAMSIFTPVMQYHSEKANPAVSEARTPWNVQARTGDTSVIPTFRELANVRMSLLPYLYTTGRRASATGEPIMQSMSFAYPVDAGAASLEDQFMFGRDILVAPIMTEGATYKDVYLPEGEWFDLWNGGTAQGPGWKRYHADKSTIPVYVRSGAILPLNLNPSYRLGDRMGNELSVSNLTFRVYPNGTSSGVYFDDGANATRTITSVADFPARKISISLPALSTPATLQVHSGRPQGVTVDGHNLPQISSLSQLGSSASGWFHDEAQQFTYVKQQAGQATRSVVLTGAVKAAYEAEFSVLSGTATNTDHANYTGLGFVDRFAEVKDAVTFDIRAERTGEHEVVLRYANASGRPATRTISVDGTRVGVVTLPNLATWDAWSTARTTVHLSQGRHTLTVSHDPENTGAINLDHLVVTPL